MTAVKYYASRFAQAIITIFAAVTLTFSLYRLMPGGPMGAMQAQLSQRLQEQGYSSDEIEERVGQLTELYTGIDPDTPIHIAYLEYLEDVVFNLDLGTSLIYQEPVIDIMARAMPWSIFVSVNGLLLGFTASVLLGSLMATWEGGRFDSGSTLAVLGLSSIPYYVGALVMLAFLGFGWGIFPTGGRYGSGVDPGVNVDFMASVIYHGAMPTLSGFILGFGAQALAMRGNSIRVIGSDYIHSARLRGIGTNRITTRYVARNAILPIYTSVMIGIAALFSGSVILEQIFQYPGMGWYLFTALTSQDYPLLMGTFIFFTILTVSGILIADLTYGLIDPRAGTGAERESF